MPELVSWNGWIQNNDLPSIEKWLENNDVNTRDVHGFYPIHHVAAHGTKEMLEILIARPGNNLHVMESGGLYPINYAAVNDKPEIMKLLLTQPDINVNIQGPKGHTPLHKAARHGKVEIVKLLLDHRGTDQSQPADPDIREWGCGETPLHKAAYRYQMNENRDGCLEVMKALVRGGHGKNQAQPANLGAVNYGRPGDQNDGKSPMDFLPPNIIKKLLDICVVRERKNEQADMIKLINPFHQPQIRSSEVFSGKPGVQLQNVRHAGESNLGNNIEGEVEFKKGMKNLTIIKQRDLKVCPKDMPETTALFKGGR